MWNEIGLKLNEVDRRHRWFNVHICPVTLPIFFLENRQAHFSFLCWRLSGSKEESVDWIEIKFVLTFSRGSEVTTKLVYHHTLIFLIFTKRKLWRLIFTLTFYFLLNGLRCYFLFNVWHDKGPSTNYVIR